MNQRSTFSRTKEPRREKIIRTRRDDEERFQDEPPTRRSSTERPNSTHASSYSRFKDNFSDKNRSNSRDIQGSLVFRRQERGKLQSNFSKNSNDVSPGKVSHADSMRNDTSGRSSYSSPYYSTKSIRDYASKRTGYLDNSHIIDDNRLKSFLHRLLRDEDKERQASLIRQLRAVFEHPENNKIVQANREDIISTFEDFIQLGLNSELKHEFVLTVGALGAILGMKAKSLLDWEFTVIGMSKCEDIRILILKTVLETLKIDTEKKSLSELVPFIMGKLQSTLEVADVPDLLIAIVNVIAEIASGYPSVFSKHFSDTVDILIGWHIDATQQLSVIEFTSSTLISFQQFWLSDMNFTVTLLGQFLEDMESYAEGLPKVKPQSKKSVMYLKELAQSKLASSASTDSQTCLPEENLAKIKSLIRVLITVLKSIGDLVGVKDNGPITSKFVIEILRGFLKYVKITVGYCFYSDLMTSANECLVLLLKLAQSNSKDVLDQLMSHIDILQTRNQSLLQEAHLISVLSIMIAFVKGVGTYLPVKFVSKMFSPVSVTRQLRLSPSSKIQKLLIELYHIVLSVKNVQIVEEFYKCIMVDIIEAHEELLKSASDSSPHVINLKSYEVSLLLSICALVEIGNIKHSLIRMFALKPSFFELMTNHLKPTKPEFARKFPALQSSILFTLYSHCQRHSHFVNSSTLVNPNAPTTSPLSSSGHSSPIMTDLPPHSSPSSGNLERIVQLLADILNGHHNSYDSKLLAAKWSSEILESIQRHLPRLVLVSPFDGLLHAALNSGFVNSTDICKASFKSLHILLKYAAFALNESTLRRFYELCVLRVNSHDPELQEQFSSLLALIPLDIILRGTIGSVSKGVYTGMKEYDSSTRTTISSLDIWTAFRGHMGRSCSGNFFAHHFRTVTGFILQGKEPQEKNWLLRLYNSCPPPERRSKVDSLMAQLTSTTSTVLWFWAIWEVAQTCVISKLRTPLGKPQDTFMAIESALKAAAKSSTNLESFQDEAKDVTLLRYHLLLCLMEHLEKYMYNAYEGCASALPSPPKNVRTFFRTNKSTCHEWLSRVRSNAVLVALNTGNPSAAVRHGFELLQEWKNAGNVQVSELETVLYSVVKALILLHCPEAVLGLYLWCKDNFNKKYNWIKASVDCAAGRLENAVHEYLGILQCLSDNSCSEKQTKQVLESSESNDKLKNGKEEEVLIKNLNGTESFTNKPQIDVHLHSFLLNQVVDCYVKLQSWPEAVKWSEFLENVKFNQNGLSIKVASSNNNLVYLRCLSSFEESSTFNRKDASTQINNLTNSELHTSSAWTVVEQFSKVQRTLMSVAINTEVKSSEPIREVTDKIDEAKGEILKLLKISGLNWPFQMDCNQAGLFISASSFQPNQKVTSTMLRENVKFDPTDCDSSTLGFLLNWENIWLGLNQTPSAGKLHGGFFDLLMSAARLSRKQQNFNMCHKLIARALNHLCKNSSCYEMKDVNFSSGWDFSAMDSLKSAIKRTLPWGPCQRLTRIQRESAKLFHCLGESDSSCNLLLSSISSVSSHLKKSSVTNPLLEHLSELNSRSMLNLVKYMQHDAKINTDNFDVNSSKETAFQSLLYNTLKGLKYSEVSALGKHFKNGLQQEKNVNDPDYLVGQLLCLSVCQCSSLAKSWCNFASWCYGHGRKVINAASNGSLSILPPEKSKLLSLIPNTHNEDVEALLKVVTSLHTSVGGEWDNQEMDCTEAEEIRFQLLTYCPFLLKLNDHEDVLEEIIEIWKDLKDRAYSYYRTASVSYLQYLKLNGQAINKEKTEDDNVTATLRLLRLVVKHALELRDVLEIGLAETPTAPWRGIIPQLFSRLNHPEPYVRQSISDLLCRVARAAPHLIVFPAVVGSLTLKVGHTFQEETSGLFGAYLSDNVEESAQSEMDGSQEEVVTISDEDSEEDHRKTAVMQNCFTALVETLGSQDERTISEAKSLIHELHRITLLWDELWLGTLNQSEVNKRFSNLEKEISKVMNNAHLSKDEKREIIKEKHDVYVKPTLFLLEHLQSITSQPAETPHEEWFQKTFEKPIEDAIHKLQNPENPSRPQESWAVFKQLFQLLQQKVQQQSRSHLSMEHISPLLASLKSTVIPMPGINKESGVVTVQAVHSTVSILPTKTKPKKLAFIGSDGHRYTYLFKGLEDLHLDERIMQFLSIVNNMFAKSKRHGKQVYYARHYSVTPLGPRSGLIQWVDGATPLFGLYKRWQQREAANKISGGNVGASLRPSEIFYNKLSPLLKEKNINYLDSRKEWPLSVLLDVLKQLMSETPDNLLAKELWCSCSSVQEWWNMTLTYNYSTAVMSIIGYIIGLGDRHLDNVLVDLSTGEVVHIDYNVCFEKGKNLRVPEKVPFRMTPNIQSALGLTGVEGVFRTSCEHVLKVLRKGRENLLTLLEAFVYDPLVDWTPGSEGGYTGAVYGGQQSRAVEAKQTRHNMEVDIAWSMFAIRVAEMKGEWLKNWDDLLTAFPKLESLLQDWKSSQQDLQVVETELQEACQEKALLEEALANPNHSLYTVPRRFDETTIVKTTVATTKEAVIEKLNECKKWQTLHSDALSSVCGTELSKRCGEVSGEESQETLSVAPVVEFLQKAGQGQLVQQCELAENELMNTLQQRRLTMRNCIELLTTYATIVLQFGPGYREQNRCFKWQQWLESLLTDFSSLKCVDIITDFRNQYGRESPDAVQSSIALNVQFQTFLTEANTKVLTILERIHLEGVDDKMTLIAIADETKCSVLCFLKEAGDSCHLAFLCVLGEALCTIRKQLFMMENAAGASGDRLVDLTSWNGDWFLDEISSTCGNLAQYVQLLLDSSVIENMELKSAFQGIQLAHFVFSALEDLRLHFETIILPEAIDRALEPSVLEMASKLDRIIARSGVPLEKLVTDLQSNITNLILKTPVSENRVSDTVKKLRNEFESLMQRSEPHITGLTQGQMLLMAFNGLFTKVDADLSALLCFLDDLSVPTSWQKMDFYSDTITLAPPIHLPGAHPILKDIYFVKKLLAMQQAFHICHNHAVSLYPGSNRETLLVSDYQPVKQFVADYVRHMVLGLPSQVVGFALCLLITHFGCDLSVEVESRVVGVESKAPTEEILLKACKMCIAKHFLDSQLPPLSTLLGAFDAAWRKEDLARRLEQYLIVAKGSQQRAQLQLARFQWLNEDLLIQANIATLQSNTVSSRATVMSEIRKTVSALVAFDCVVNSAQERYLNLTAGIEQRLKWAAGANPSLTTVQEEFEAAIICKTEMILTTNQMSRELVTACNSILHFEALRTRTTEALSSDNIFISLINRCKETCELAEACQSQISTIEEHLISLQPLEKESVTSEWLTSIIQKVSQSLGSCREKLELQKTSTNACWDSLHLQVAHVHDLISVHHKLMSEVRHILRNLAKHEEQELGVDQKSEGPVHCYMTIYKEFSERISHIVSKLLTEAQDMDASTCLDLEKEIVILCSRAIDIYEGLLKLAGPLGSGQQGKLERKLCAVKRNFLSPSCPHSPGLRNTHKKSAVARDPRTGKAVQERNTYATNVWKRIKMKLDGKDLEPSKKSSISEQVDFVIQEATHLENLAVLYEGWTPWV